MNDKKKEQELDSVSGGAGYGTNPVHPVDPPYRPPTHPKAPIDPVGGKKSNPVG